MTHVRSIPQLCTETSSRCATLRPHIANKCCAANNRGGAMRKDIEFKTEDGVTLRGWHYLPDGRRGKVPTIVMAHGFSAVKEMYLDRFAEAFAAGGLVRSCLIIAISVRATANPARRSTRGAKCGTIAMRLPTPRPWKRRTPTASGFGDRVTAADMFLSSARSTGGEVRRRAGAHGQRA
jgi:hypothetical protein